MEIEDRDFFGRAIMVEAPTPVSAPGALLVRSKYAWAWPPRVAAPALDTPSAAARVLCAAIRDPSSTLRHLVRALTCHEHRGWRLALDHHLGAHERFVRAHHTCAAVAGHVLECGAGLTERSWPAGTPVAGFAFKTPPDAALQLLSPQFTVMVPSDLHLAAAALLMPAAMIRHGLVRGIARSQPASIVICGSNTQARLAVLYARDMVSEVVSAASIPRFPARHALVVVVSSEPLLAERCDGMVWIQSAPADPDAVTRARQVGIEVVAVPDPWHQSNLDVLSEAALEVPDWGTPASLRETLAWLSRRQHVILSEMPQTSWRCPSDAPRRSTVTVAASRRRDRRRLRVSFIGAGEFAPMLIKYVLREPDVALRGVADLRPGRARFVADLYGFQLCSTEAATIIDDDATDCVFVVTDHHSHAALAVAALLAGKSVFVEKPPAVNPEQLRTLLGAMAAGHTSLQVGYNRNFAPLIHRLREHLDRDTGPTETRIDRRPYPVTPNSWYYWPKEGTRIVSNACHFLDVAYRIAGRPQPLSVTAMAVPDGRPDEHATIAAQFEDGSLCTIRFSNDVAGDEMLFARRGRRSACLRGFAHLELYDGNQMVAARTQEPDFGHAAEVEDFLRGCRSGGRAFCSPRDLAATSMLTFAADESLRLQRTINVVTAA